MGAGGRRGGLRHNRPQSSSGLYLYSPKSPMNYLVSNFYNKLKFPHFFPCETSGRKAREISICCRNCSQGSCSYFEFPLNISIQMMQTTLSSNKIQGIECLKICQIMSEGRWNYFKEQDTFLNNKSLFSFHCSS